MLRTTHTFVRLAVSEAAYKEIEAKLKEAGYDHCFVKQYEEKAVIDMAGIALEIEDKRGDS